MGPDHPLLADEDKSTTRRKRGMPRPLRAALTGEGPGNASDVSQGRFLRPDRKQVQVDCGDSAPAQFRVFELADQALPSRPTNNHLSWIIPFTRDAPLAVSPSF